MKSSYNSDNSIQGGAPEIMSGDLIAEVFQCELLNTLTKQIPNVPCCSQKNVWIDTNHTRYTQIIYVDIPSKITRSVFHNSSTHKFHYFS